MFCAIRKRCLDMACAQDVLHQSQGSKYSLTRTFASRRVQPWPSPPYTVGKTYAVRPHRPGSAPEEYIYNASAELRKAGREGRALQYGLNYQPPPGVLGQGTVSFEITGRIRAGDNLNAQLIKVKILHSSTSVTLRAQFPNEELVAKIFDPLHWDYLEAPGTDPYKTVDAQYAREFQAYDYLKPLLGSVVPRFYGSYSIEVPIPRRKKTRTVRMILMEHVCGASLSSLDPNDYTVQQRQAIMGAVIDKFHLMESYNVHQGDFWPRNVILISVDKEGLNADIRWIDFGTAASGYCSEENLRKTNADWTGQDSFNRWCRCDLAHIIEEFDEWAEGWDWDEWLRHRFLV